MRLIDADALKEYIGSVRAEFNFFDDDERKRYEAHSKAIYLLDLYASDAPSIDIVRCGECKHNVGLSNGDGFWEEDIVCDYWESDGLTADDSCSHGERKESE